MHGIVERGEVANSKYVKGLLWQWTSGQSGTEHRPIVFPDSRAGVRGAGGRGVRSCSRCVRTRHCILPDRSRIRGADDDGTAPRQSKSAGSPRSL